MWLAALGIFYWILCVSEHEYTVWDKHLEFALSAIKSFLIGRKLALSWLYSLVLIVFITSLILIEFLAFDEIIDRPI